MSGIKNSELHGNGHSKRIHSGIMYQTQDWAFHSGILYRSIVSRIRVGRLCPDWKKTAVVTHNVIDCPSLKLSRRVGLQATRRLSGEIK